MSEETGGGNIDLTDFSQEKAPEAPPIGEAAAGDDIIPVDQGAPAADDEISVQDAVAKAKEVMEPGSAGPGPNHSDDDDDQRSASDLEAVFEVPVNIAAVLGGTHMEVSDLLKLNEGDVVELDRKVGEAIDIFVNNRLVARGEVVLVEDRLGVTMTEIIKG